MAKLKLERLRPTRATFAGVFGLLWAVSFGALRDFVWADIRAGLIDLRGLSRATRTLVWFGLALLVLMVGALLFNDALRAQSNLIAKTVSVTGRGALLPEMLLLLTLFMLSIAWGFLLTGALHSRPLIRVALLLIYLVLSGWRVLNMATGSALSGEVFNTSLWLSFGAWLAVPLFFVLRRRAQAHPIVEFTVLFTLIAVNFAVSQSDGVGTWRDYGIPLTLAELEASIQLPGIFILPLLLFFGIDVANFARRAAGWTVDIVTQRMARWALWVILIAVCAWRLWTVIAETTQRLAQDNLATTLSLYASALAVPLLVAAVWVLVGEGWPWRRSRAGIPQPDAVSEIAEKVALPLITLYMIASIVASWTIPSQVFDAGGLVVSLGALAATFWLSRRGRHGRFSWHVQHTEHLAPAAGEQTCYTMHTVG
ncbi:MAG: hypothetical protein M1546_01355 [Chloroflexi bacterium]|nr:hypothetical protein [Chloroflexota bacterium]